MFNLKTKKTSPFTIASKEKKHLRKDLTKEVQGLYTENYKTLFKKIKEDLNKWIEDLLLLIWQYY